MKRLPTALVLSLVACAGARPAPHAKATASAGHTGPSACDRATTLRARLPKLLEQGRIDRVVRTAKRADELCGEGVATAWAPTLNALAELGRDEEARALAKTIDANAEAPREAKEAAARYRARVDPPIETGDLEALQAKAEEAATSGDHAAARDAFLAVWRRTRPNGRALVDAGLQAKAMKDAPAAQRLFDRALLELERDAGKPARAATVTSTGRLRWNHAGTRFVVEGSFGDEQVLLLGRWSASGPVLERALDNVAQLAVGSFDFLPGDRSLIMTNGSELDVVDLDSGAITPIDEAALYDIAEDGKTLYYVTSDGRSQLVAYDLEARTPIASGEAPAIVDRPINVGYLKNAHRLYAYSDGVYVYDASLKPIIKGDNLAAWAFSDDEAMLAAVVLEPPILNLYEVATGKLTKSVPLVADETAIAQGGVAFTHDRKQVALVNRGGPLLLVDVKSGRVRAMPPNGDDATGEIFWNPTFTADNKRLCGVLESTTHAACVLDVAALRWLPERKNDHATTLVGFGKHRAIAIDLKANADGAVGAEADGSESPFTTPVLSPDEKTLLVHEIGSGGASSYVVGVDVATKRILFTASIEDEASSGCTIVFGADSKTAMVSASNVAVLLEIPSGRVIARIPRSPDSTTDEYRGDGRVFALRDAANATQLVDVATGAVHRLSAVTTGGAVTALSPDGAFAAVHELDGELTIWDLDKSAPQKTLTPNVPINTIVLDAGAKRMAVAMGGTIHLLDANDGSEPVALTAPGDGLSAIAFDPSGARLYGAKASGGIHVWSTKTGEIETTLIDAAHHRGARWLAFDPSGRWLSATQEKMSELWDLAEASLLRSGERSGPTAFSPDGKLLAIGRDLLDFHSGRVELSVDSKIAPSAVAFSLDGASALFSTNEVFTMSTASGAVTRRPIAEPSASEDDESPPAEATVTPGEEVTRFAPRASGSSVLGLLRGGELGVFSSDLRLRARFIATAHGTAYVTNDAGTLELLGDASRAPAFICVVGASLLPFDVCAERLLAPGLLARALDGDELGEP